MLVVRRFVKREEAKDVLLILTSRATRQPVACGASQGYILYI